MRSKINKYIFIMLIILIISLQGCDSTASTKIKNADPIPKIEITRDSTVGAVAEVFAFDYIPVEGYSLVGGLAHTGSEQCSPGIYSYLEKYIKNQLPQEKNVDSYITSDTTSVVMAEGMMPASLSNEKYFDIFVSAPPATQTTSLQGGRLWGAELWEAGKFGVSLKRLATAEGEIYIDQIDNPNPNLKFGFILGGGKVVSDYGNFAISIKYQDYKVTAKVRNRINERFGNNTATAELAGQIILKPPAEYDNQRRRFLGVIQSIYLIEDTELRKERISEFARKLAVADDKDQPEYALEAIGKDSIEKLSVLLNSSKPEVKFRAARCLLNLGSDQGLETLRKMALDENSSYRSKAFGTISLAAKRNDAIILARKLIRDKNIDIVIEAYKKLNEFNDLSINRISVSGNFYLDQLIGAEEKVIYVTRSGRPAIALFGGPLECKKNIFIQSKDQSVTINAPVGQEYVSILRKHPKRPNLPPIQLKSSYRLRDIILTLCQNPLDERHPGLNVPYADMISILDQLVKKNGIDAQFKAGPMPKIAQFIKE